MRKISAHLIMDGRGKTYPKGIVTLDEGGTIIGIEDTKNVLTESSGIEFYSGILVPGFVNAHCHLELSHLKQAYQEGSGFISFISQVTKSRYSEREEILEAAEKADLQMFKNGIVAVGDIANEPTVFDVKGSSKICYYTFVEALGFVPDRAGRAFERAKACLEAAGRAGLRAGIVPHSPYSISRPLFQAIAEAASDEGTILSIHSQESKEEDELYHSGKGELIGHLQNNLCIDTSFFLPSGQNALRSTLEYLPTQNNLLLIHNLYTQQSDIDYISGIRKLEKTWFVLCPGSNLYIQKRLPDVDLFRNNKLQIGLGTDSLGSNHQLSILEEMKIIQSAFPHIPLEELVTWSSYNGARALKMDEWAGSIEAGKKPGINLLTGADLSERRLLPGTRVKKLI